MPNRSVPTVHVFLESRSGQADWCWTPWRGEAAAEYAYTRDDLLKLSRTYGNWASIMTGGAHVRVTIRGCFSGRYLVQHEWAGGGPIGEPWIHIPDWHALAFAAQLHIPQYADHDEHRLIDTGETDVRTLRLNPVPDTLPGIPTPHVRDREDVPHEHALADLYGLPGGYLGRYGA